MLKDIFSKQFEIPEIVKVDRIDNNVADYIERGTGSYAGDIIIKPNKFKMVNYETNTIPLYVEVIR
jgi:hypothetical protein